jgi:hypothetical protein
LRNEPSKMALASETTPKIAKACRAAGRFASQVFFLCLLVFSATAFGRSTTAKIATSENVKAFFRRSGKRILTFVGYSGVGYEDQAAMLARAERILRGYDPTKTIVNIGATPEGIGAIYELAKRRGFVTSGIVSTLALQANVALSPYVDIAFFVKDPTWGGYLSGTNRLSPTSKAMVENSDIVVGIGGGEVARDELLAAQRSGKQVYFFPADMSHQKARETARRKGLPLPTDFHGAARSPIN